MLSCCIFCSLSFAIETMSCWFSPMLMITKMYFSFYPLCIHPLHIAAGYFSVSCWWWWFSSIYLSLKDQCSFTSVSPPGYMLGACFQRAHFLLDAVRDLREVQLEGWCQFSIRCLREQQGGWGGGQHNGPPWQELSFLLGFSHFLTRLQ